MNIFKKYKTIEEVRPGFIMEKEVTTLPKAAQTYLHQTQVLIDWLKGQGLGNISMRKITQQNITDFFYYLSKDIGLDRPTCEKYFLHNRLLFKYAKRHGEIDEVPFDFVVFPRKKKDQGADAIQSVHLKPLLEEVRRVDPQLFLGCIIQYYCFIRPGKELRLLKVGDINLEAGLIKVSQMNAKNKKEQLVTMPNQLIEICKEYGIDKADKSFFIFGKKHRFGPKPISENTLRYNFNKVRDRLGLPKGYKFYSFKHTGASALHMSGISMRELMDQLRHTKLEATQHYLKKHCGIVNDRIRDNFPSPI